MRSAYVTASRIAELRRILTPEEWAILRDTATMRLAPAGDLQTLRSGVDPVNVRSFRRTLARLAEQGVLARLDRTVGGRRAGSSGYVYGVGPAGQRLLNPHGPSRRPWAPRPSWLQHALAVSHLYVTLRELENGGQLKLLTFDAEPRCYRSFPSNFGTSEVLKPDVFVVTGHRGYELVRFIEVDCGTESPSTIARKLNVYWRYYQSGLEQQRAELFPEVLWLVPSERRRGVLVDVASHRPPEAWQLHRVARYDQARVVFTDERPP